MLKDRSIWSSRKQITSKNASWVAINLFSKNVGI